MDHAVLEAATIKATLGPDDRVWWIDGDRAPEPSGRPLAAFVATLADSARVRIVAVPANVPLIARLHAHPGLVVEVCRPHGTDWSGLIARDPRAALYESRTVGVAASCGGWHRLTAGDAVSYEVALALAEGDDAAAITRVADHPAYRAVTFFAGLDRLRLARMVAAVLDPRWFVRPSRPDRGARLRCHFGLADRPPRGSLGRRERRRLAINVWKTADRPPADLADPRLVLWRVWCDAASSGDLIAADVATARFFLSFLRDAWLDATYPLRHRVAARGPQGLLIPSQFFPEPATHRAFAAHMAGDGRDWGAPG